MPDHNIIVPQRLLFDRDNKRHPGEYVTVGAPCEDCWGPNVNLSESERVLRILLFLCLLKDAQAFQGSLSKENIAFPLKTDSYSEGSENSEGLKFFIFKSKKS